MESKCSIAIYYNVFILTIVLLVQKQAYELGILHCDCSLHNAMIGDLGHGMLIDWEFAVNIMPDNKYHILVER